MSAEHISDIIFLISIDKGIPEARTLLPGTHHEIRDRVKLIELQLRTTSPASRYPRYEKLALHYIWEDLFLALFLALSI